MAFGTLRVISEVGFKVPDDLSLLVGDDSLWFAPLRPFLSTIRQPAEDYADQAWAMMMARLNHDRSPILHSEVYCNTVIRDSTVPLAASSR